MKRPEWIIPEQPTTNATDERIELPHTLPPCDYQPPKELVTFLRERREERIRMRNVSVGEY